MNSNPDQFGHENIGNGFEESFDIPDNIIHLKLRYISLYLVRGTKGLVLIDTGLPRKEKKLFSLIEGKGVNLDEIKFILLTHGHIDHYGCAALLKKRFGVKVAINKEDAVNLEVGLKTIPKARNFLGYFMKLFLLIGRYFFKSEGIQPDFILEDGDSLEQFGLKGSVVHTPGHTKGSVSFLIDEGQAFVGDLVTYYNNRPYQPPFSENVNLICKSLLKLYKNQLKIIYPSHGIPFKPGKVADLFQQICIDKDYTIDDLYDERIAEIESGNAEF